VEIRGVADASEIRGKTHADADVVVMVSNRNLIVTRFPGRDSWRCAVYQARQRFVGKRHADADVIVIVPNFRGRKWKLGRRPTIFRVYNTDGNAKL